MANQIGDSSLGYAEGLGTVNILALVNGHWKWEHRVLKDVLFIPTLKKN